MSVLNCAHISTRSMETRQSTFQEKINLQHQLYSLDIPLWCYSYDHCIFNIKPRFDLPLGFHIKDRVIITVAPHVVSVGCYSNDNFRT